METLKDIWRVQKIYGVGDGFRMNIRDYQVTEVALRSRTPYMSRVTSSQLREAL